MYQQLINFIVVSGLFSFWLLTAVVASFTSKTNLENATKWERSDVLNIFKKMAIPSAKKLSQQFNLSDIFNATEEDLNQCYSARLNSSSFKVDVFRDTLTNIVHRYFLAFPEHINANKNFKQKTLLNKQERVIYRTGHLLKTLSALVKLVKKCLKTEPKKRTKFGLNSLSAISDEEFSSSLIKLNFENRKTLKQNNITTLGDNGFGFECEYSDDPSVLPLSYDARNFGLVTRVKQQGSCGSCYIFSAIGQMEAALALAYGKDYLTDLSEQEWLNCLNEGCDGGIQDLVWQAILYNGGTTRDESLPYTAMPDQCVHFQDDYKIRGYCIGWEQYSDDQIRSMVYKYGALAVAISANSLEFKNFRGTVYNGPCSQELDHAVLLVGYTENTWIVKNSWSEEWGDSGYFQLPRGDINMCGINTLAAASWA